MGMHVIVRGNPFDGLTIHGPFATGEEAHEWADAYCRDVEWWAVALESPEGHP